MACSTIKNIANLTATCLILAACQQDVVLNSPYPHAKRTEKVLYQPFAERPKHLDPARSYSSNEYAIIGQIYEPPLQYHYLLRPYRLEPLTLSQMPKVAYFNENNEKIESDNQNDKIKYSEYLLKIKPKTYFQPHPAFVKHNGKYTFYPVKLKQIPDIFKDEKNSTLRELTADDYVYQIKRLADPNLHSPIYGIMQKYIYGLEQLRKNIKQAKTSSWLDLRKFALKGVKTIDKYTYKIRIKGKYPQFKFWLAMPFFAPVAWEVDRFYAQKLLKEKHINLDWYPVGTGPFMLTINDPNSKMVLEKNPNYHDDAYPDTGEPEDTADMLLVDSGKTLPFLDKVIFSLEKENIPEWNKFLQGYYDASGINSDSFDQAINISDIGNAELTSYMQGKGIQLKTSVATSTFYMGFNMLDPVIGGLSQKAKKLRQAISIAFDYEEYISIFANGRGIPAQSPIPPGIFGNLVGEDGINHVVYNWQDGKYRRKSIDQAKKLLQEAGYPDGKDAVTGKQLVLNFDSTGSGPDSKSIADWYRKQFAKLNVQLNIRNTDYNRFQEKIRKGKAQIFVWGWNADYPDPENFLFLLYGPNAKVDSGGENAVNYKNPEYDRLFAKMQNMENSPERLVIIKRMLDILREDAPWIWGIHPKSFGLYHSWYKNRKPNLMANNTLKYVRIEPEIRYKKQTEWNRPIFWPLAVFIIIFLLLFTPAWISYKKREHKTARI